MRLHLMLKKDISLAITSALIGIFIKFCLKWFCNILRYPSLNFGEIDFFNLQRDFPP